MGKVLVKDSGTFKELGSTTTGATQAYVDAKIAQTITDGNIATAPSEDAVFDALALKQAFNANLTTLAGLDSATAGAIASDGAGWVKKTYAQFKTALGLVKADVGLGSVDNTADTAKPVSTAQQTALDLKAPLASPTFTGTVAGITKTMVGLGNVDNTADSAKPVSTAQQTALDLKLTTPGAWSTYTPALTAVTTNPNLGTSPTQYGHYLQIGKLVQLTVKIQFGTGGTVAAGSGIYKVSLPVNALAAAVTATVSLGAGQMFDSSAGTSKACTVRLDSASTVRFTTEAAGDTTNAVPWTWAASDFISFTITYEAA